MFIVTGGSGLIGSALVWGLNRAGIDDILVVEEMLRAGKVSGCAVEGVLHMGAC